MDNIAILTMIDLEIAKLNSVRALLMEVESGTKRGRGRPKKEILVASAAKPQKRRKLSAEARAKIAAAQKARWAKQRKG
jgi:hypothetical protein